MEVEDVILKKIDDLKREIEAHEAALEALQKSKAKRGSPSMRFFKMRPLYATRLLLEERGTKMLRTEIEEALMAGGIAVGRKRSGHNVRISLDLNIANGNLVAKGDYIDLPERSKS